MSCLMAIAVVSDPDLVAISSLASMMKDEATGQSGDVASKALSGAPWSLLWCCIPLVIGVSVVAVLSCVVSLCKMLANSRAKHWRNWVFLTLAGKARLNRRLLGTDVSGGDDPAQQGETSDPAVGKDVGVEDLGTCWTDTDDTNSRFKPWRNVVLESTQETSDSVVSGPATALPLCRKMLQHGPERWFAEWAKELSIGRKDRAGHEMHTMIDIFYQEGCNDQLNMGALACKELVSRRLQQYTEEPTPPNWASAEHVSGSSSSLDLVPPEMSESSQQGGGKARKFTCAVQDTRGWRQSWLGDRDCRTFGGRSSWCCSWSRRRGERKWEERRVRPWGPPVLFFERGRSDPRRTKGASRQRSEGIFPLPQLRDLPRSLLVACWATTQIAT